MTGIRVARRAVALGAAAAALAGCDLLAHGPSDEPVAPEALEQLEEAPAPVRYYLGRSYDGLPLTHADWRRAWTLFVYGPCDWAPENEHGVCRARQVKIQQFPFDASAWRAAVGCRRMFPARGVPTLWHGGLALITDGFVVKVFGRDGKDSRRAARMLRAANGGPGAGEPLPAPGAEAVALVDAACGAKPGERGPTMSEVGPDSSRMLRERRPPTPSR